MAQLPYSSHDYSGFADIAAMLGLVSASWKRNWPRNRFHVGDVWWYLGLGREETPDNPHPLDQAVDRSATAAQWGSRGWTAPAPATRSFTPTTAGQGIEEEMLAWLEERHRIEAAPDGGESTLETGSYGDPYWLALLVSNGFHHDDSVDGWPLYWRSLDALESERAARGLRRARGRR